MIRPPDEMARANELSHQVIGAAIEVHKYLGRDCWNRRIKLAWSES